MLRGECPDALRCGVFNNERDPVPWKGLSDSFNYISLKMIVQRLLQVNTSSSTLVELCIRGERQLGHGYHWSPSIVSPVQPLLFCSKYNLGAVDSAHSVCCTMQQSIHGIRTVTDADFDACPGATHFLLVLNAATFCDSKDTGGVDEAALLIGECRRAFERRVPFLLVHVTEGEDSCPFEVFFDRLPRDLLMQGIFKDIATPWMRHQAFRDLSIDTLANKLGAPPESAALKARRSGEKPRAVRARAALRRGETAPTPRRTSTHNGGELPLHWG